MKVKALVLSGEGINCDYETALAFSLAGAESKRVHINDLIAGWEKLEEFHIIAFPGGFSFGDHLGAGKALANKIKNAFSQGTKLFDGLKDFIENGRLVIGICNGFQVLVKLGLLPALKAQGNQEVSLFFNDSARFEDRWVKLKVNKTNCVFTRGIERIDLPCRHAEGKFVADRKTINELWKNSLVVMQYADDSYNPSYRYPLNPNGSIDAIAGICDKTGRVFGLMPHPEAFLFFENHPQWTRLRNKFINIDEMPKKGDGQKIFENAVDYIKMHF